MRERHSWCLSEWASKQASAHNTGTPIKTCLPLLIALFLVVALLLLLLLCAVACTRCSSFFLFLFSKYIIPTIRIASQNSTEQKNNWIHEPNGHTTNNCSSSSSSNKNNDKSRQTHALQLNQILPQIFISIFICIRFFSLVDFFFLFVCTVFFL